MSFYRRLSPYYDEMINLNNRLDTEQTVFQTILKKFPASTALDAGCGSGFHSILLSRIGLEVTGIDMSDEMLSLAEKNAKTYGVQSEFIKADFLFLDRKLTQKYDAIFCLGNSFVHLLKKEDQLRALNNFKSLLTPGGYLCLQIINYDKILSEKTEILAERNIGDKKITRLYLFNDETITFTVRVESGGDKEEFSTELYPLRYEEMHSLIKKVGFAKIFSYGNLKLDPYQQKKSENLCQFCFA